MSAAEVLAEHQYGISQDPRCLCGFVLLPSDADMAAHQLDALKAAGFAVVELPSVDDDSPEVIAPSWSVREQSGPIRIQQARARDGLVEFDCERRWQVFPPDEARAVAAALLAAADAAERAS